MTSPTDEDPLQQPRSLASTPVLNVRKTRSHRRDESPDTSTTSLPIRSGSPPSLTSRASTITSALSRSSSPNGRLSLSLARFGKSSVASPLGTPSESYDDTRSLLVRAFSPMVAVYASPETDGLARRKGIKNGFVDLMRPYGDRITGKVVVRDSTGASRAWEDFGVHFHDLGGLVQNTPPRKNDGPLENLEELLEQYVTHVSPEDEPTNGLTEMSPYYRLLLSRLMTSQSTSPHETFQHPVATVIAICSATPAPIETLRGLYSQTAQGTRALPPYANPEYLRYYVLVHDEDRDDFSKSSALFDQMKRHFGLHCHLLRLRSSPCSPSNHDSEETAAPEWLSAAEDLSRLENSHSLLDLGSSTTSYIHTTDATALRTFVRELVAQSIIPHMEQRIALWNEQIASRRRGISGRFMSLSKRWAGVGGLSRSTSSATNVAASGASGNYDGVQGLYRYDTPEALLRKLADYAFMLRDYKLAASTYELLRGDYANDKAWKYLAGANEMCCISNLLNPLASGASAKIKVDNFDQMLETASYSYLTRCAEPALALRCMVLSVELLKVRGRAANELATKWAIRVLDAGLVGSIGHVLVSERVVSCLATQLGVGNAAWGTRKRKAALWSVMTAEEWMKLGRAEFASTRLDEAQELYSEIKRGDSINDFKELANFMHQLQLAVRMKLGQARQRGLSAASKPSFVGNDDDVETEVEETTEGDIEQLHDTRQRRRSLMGAMNPLEMPVPLSPVRNRDNPLLTKADDNFE